MKLGFALGGGGARGSAHIGVLEELFKLGLKPDLIAGTSIGGLTGALIAADFSPDELAEIMQRLTPSSMYALPPGNRSITSSERVETILLESFAKKIKNRARPQFEDLKIPLAVIATDLVAQREVVLAEGDLVRALLATICVPVLFPPVVYGDMQLVDGGMVNNVPLDVVRARGATFTIAVDLSNSAPYGTEEAEPVADQHPSGANTQRGWDSLWEGMVGEIEDFIEGRFIDRALSRAARRPLWQVVTTVFDIVTSQNTKLNLAFSPPDVLIRPYIGTIGILDFHTVDAGRKAGREAVQKATPELENLLTQMARLRASERQMAEKHAQAQEPPSD